MFTVRSYSPFFKNATKVKIKTSTNVLTVYNEQPFDIRDWSWESRAHRAATNGTPQRRHEAACFRKSEHGQFKCWWHIVSLKHPWAGFSEAGGEEFTIPATDMRLHVIIAAVFWCGFVDSRKIRGISSSCKFIVALLALKLRRCHCNCSQYCMGYQSGALTSHKLHHRQHGTCSYKAVISLNICPGH